MTDLYELREVNGVDFSYTIDALNRLDPYFPELQERHMTDGYWWIVYKTEEPAAFAGLVPFHPFNGYGYLKRCLVKPDHRSHGLQLRLMCARELKARQLGWSHLISECLECNSHSIANHRRAGFETFDPEQPWGSLGTVYWMKVLA